MVDYILHTLMEKKEHTTTHPQPKGTPRRTSAHEERIIILDIDGVLFKGQFFLKLLQRKSLFSWIAAYRDAVSFSMERIDLPQLLAKSYRRLKGMSTETLDEVFEATSRRKNAKETIQELKQRGCRVFLLSSGVPDRFVQQLVAELGADQGKGINVHTEDNALTGGISGVLTTEAGKREIVEAWLREYRAGWEQVTVIGDDRNNLPIMELAAVSIGFHATLSVRRKASFLVETDDFSDVLPAITHPEKPVKQHDLATELRRRVIHISAFAFPFLFAHLPDYSSLTLVMLFVIMGIYCISEYLRLNGIVFPGFGTVMKLTIRKAEGRHFAAAPVALAAGVLACLFFPPPTPSVAIGVVAFGDSAAGLTGQFLGRHHLFYNMRKTVEGMAASMVTCTVLCLFFLPLLPSLVIALFASIVESLPLGQWDNLIVPLSTAFLCWGWICIC